MSARCSVVGTYSTAIVPDETNPLKKWKRTSMCFVLAELSGFDARLIAPSLSTYALMVFSEIEGTMKDATDFANRASFTPSPSAGHSASLVESDTVFCVELNHQIV